MDPPDRAASTNVAADGEIAVAVGPGREKNDDEIHLGLVVTPALDAEDVEKLLRELERVLAERYPGVNWKITAVRESLLTPRLSSLSSSMPRARGCWRRTGTWLSMSRSFRCESHAARC